MNALLQQAQQMQEQLAAGPAAAARHRGRGHRRRRRVTVKVNGVGELVASTIKAGGFDGSDADDLSDLGDMIVAAYRDAKAQADAMATEALGPLAGGWAARRPACPASSGSRDRHSMYEGVVQDLIDELGRLPGVGPKSAQRIAFHLLQAEDAPTYAGWPTS